MESMRNRATDRAEITEPTVRIPKGHEMSPQEISALVEAYRSEYVQLNANPNSFSLNVAVESFRKQVIQSSAAILAFDKQMAARQAERDAIAQAAQAERDAAAQAERDAANELLRTSHLQTWTNQGGSTAEFDVRWPEMRLRILEEKTLAAQQERRAKTANTWQ